MEIGVPQSILNHKKIPKALWENDYHNLQDGEKYCVSSSYLWS